MPFNIFKSICITGMFITHNDEDGLIVTVSCMMIFCLTVISSDALHGAEMRSASKGCFGVCLGNYDYDYFKIGS